MNRDVPHPMLPGTERAVSGNAPLPLTHPRRMWIVRRGKLDIFAVDGRGGHRHYLFSAEPGEAVLGTGSNAAVPDLRLVAAGVLDTGVVEVDLDELDWRDPDRRAAFRALLEGHARRLAAVLSRSDAIDADFVMEPESSPSLGPGQTARVQRDVVWLRVQRGHLHFAGARTTRLGPDGPAVPLGRHAWIEARDDAQVTALPEGPDDERGLLGAAEALQAAFLLWTADHLRNVRERDAHQISNRTEADSRAAEVALSSLARVLEAPDDESRPAVGRRPLMVALEEVGRSAGIEFQELPQSEAASGWADEIRGVARCSAVGMRRVVLDGHWWKEDIGPLLGFRSAPEEDLEAEPVAILPRGPRACELYDPVLGTRTVVDAGVASTLTPFAYTFYRPLPARPLRLSDLLPFVVQGIRHDLRTLAIVAVLGAVLGLIVPIATGYVFDSIIPSADRVQLVHLLVGLVVAQVASTAFELTRALATVRLQSRIVPSLQMAVLDRLVRLPPSFFAGYTAGDLGERALRITLMGNLVGGATVSSLLSSVVALGSFALLFYYSPPLALAATVLIVLVAVVTAAASVQSIRYERAMQDEQGRISGLVLGLLVGIAKLRVSASEARAFARWAERFRLQRMLRFRVGRIQNYVHVFSAVMSVASLLVVYGLYVRLVAGGGAAISTGRFLAFYAAFGTSMSAGLAIASTVVALIGIIPSWGRVEPIVQAVPESDPSRPHPGRLAGRVEASHVSFRFSADGPQILDDVSVVAEPGEFIAIVGPSGAGKSTLLRLLLGFHPPGSGAVYYDGHDLTTVDVTAVRRQIGVVLQASRLIAGDVFRNIVGSSSRTIEDAWRAARMAGMEEDLKAMPMGMHTIVSEGGTNVSGGQRQRLLIARALVTQPRILFFDEATSALDNRTQQIVIDSLASLQATRVVIAHRLSTIRNADRIYVVDRGRMVQSGTFEQLMATPGLFRELARRQEMES